RALSKRTVRICIWETDSGAPGRERSTEHTGVWCALTRPLRRTVGSTHAHTHTRTHAHTHTHTHAHSQVCMLHVAVCLFVELELRVAYQWLRLAGRPWLRCY